MLDLLAVKNYPPTHTHTHHFDLPTESCFVFIFPAVVLIVAGKQSLQEMGIGRRVAGKLKCFFPIFFAIRHTLLQQKIGWCAQSQQNDIGILL